MKPFEYARAGDVAEALELVGGPAGSVPLAGGTDLLTLMKANIAAPAKLVDIKRAAGLDGRIEELADGLEIGALATLSDIEANALIRERYTALAEACDFAATPQLRNMATIGGNLLQRPRCWYFRNHRIDCWLKGGTECPARKGENQLHALFANGPCVAVHPSDPAGPLMALGAEVRLRSSAGERKLPLESFFAPPENDRRLETRLAPGELVVSIRIPASPDVRRRSTYLKAMPRNAWAFAEAGVAVSAEFRGDVLEEIRIVLTGVANVPWRASAAEARLRDGSADPSRFNEAADAALASARPLNGNAYKVPLAKALIRKALERTVGGTASEG